MLCKHWLREGTFEDTIGVIRSRKLKDRDKMAKRQSNRNKTKGSTLRTQTTQIT